MSYQVGDVVRLRAAFTDLNGVATDPTAVTVKIRNPAGTITTPAAVNDASAVGAFYYDLTVTESGTWAYRFEGTGAVTAADEDTINVDSSLFVDSDTDPLANSPLCSAWITEGDVEACCEVEGLPDLVKPIRFASEVLFYASGSKFPGVCSLTFAPALCYPVCDGRIDLRKVTGGFPVVSITSVRLNGDVLTANVDYRLDEGRWLTRLSQVGTWTTPWPTWQRTDIPIADMDFVVELTYGADPPDAGKQAAAAYACELAKACSSETSGECQLPEGVQNVVRDGITFSVVNPQDFLDNKNRTGIPKVDQWLQAVNPSGQTSLAFIMSPEDLSYGLVV